MSTEAIQAGNQLPNIRPEIVNYERRPSKPKQTELWTLLIIVAVCFLGFLVVPMILVIVRSFTTAGGAATLENYATILSRPEFTRSITNSLTVASVSALVAVLLAFLLSYTINCTNVPAGFKKAVALLAQLPMLLPTITYGFAIIYSFGKNGLITQLIGHPLFDIYGFNAC